MRSQSITPSAVLMSTCFSITSSLQSELNAQNKGNHEEHKETQRTRRGRRKAEMNFVIFVSSLCPLRFPFWFSAAPRERKFLCRFRVAGRPRQATVEPRHDIR